MHSYVCKWRANKAMVRIANMGQEGKKKTATTNHEKELVPVKDRNFNCHGFHRKHWGTALPEYKNSNMHCCQRVLVLASEDSFP
jgi:hypothetical protein